MQRKDQPGSDGWNDLREAQALTAKTVPHVGLAVTIDLGDANDIHPRNKLPVGERLALVALRDTYGKDVGPKTTVLILGDARNNYHASQSWVVKEMQHKARHVYWLNPEPRSYWDTGDSIVGEYGTHCDGTFECRNLRQLEKFVDVLT